jgi:hypothetical protein
LPIFSGGPLLILTQVALCDLHVQAYFCLRLWVISKKWYVVAPMATFFVFAFLAIAVAVRTLAVLSNRRLNRV